MSSYQIIAASIRHVRPMSECMRAAPALDGYGFNPRAALRRAFRSSSHCRTALVDGRPAAMWGVIGTLLGDSAYVWLVLSKQIRRMPVAIVREAKAELARVMENRSEVKATVLPDDVEAVRFAGFLGFRPEGRLPIGDSFATLVSYHPEAR